MWQDPNYVRITLHGEGSTVLARSPGMTVGEALAAACARRNTQPREYFLRMRGPGDTFVVLVDPV